MLLVAVVAAFEDFPALPLNDDSVVEAYSDGGYLNLHNDTAADNCLSLEYFS